MSKGNGSRKEIVEARHEVEIAKAMLRARVEAATESSRRVVQRVASTAKPLLLAAAGVGLMLVAVGIYRLARIGGKTSRWRRPGRSLVGEMIRAALISAAGRLAARVAGQVELPKLTRGEMSQSANPAE